MVLLVEEILNHLGCIKPCEYWDKLIYLSTGAGFFPSTVSSCFHHKPDLDPNSSNWSVGVNWSHCLTAILCYNSFKKQMRFYPYTLLHGRYAVFQETNTTCMYIYIYLYIFNFPIFIGFSSTCPWDPLVTNFHNLTKTTEHVHIFFAIFCSELLVQFLTSVLGTKLLLWLLFLWTC